MTEFRRLREEDLAGLSDEDLIEYVLDASEADDQEAVLLALQIFAFGMQDALLTFVRSRLDRHGDVVIEEVAAKALEDSIRSIRKFRGASGKEARAFVFKIAKRRIVDYLRSNRIDTAPIEVDWGEGEHPHPEVEDPGVDGEADAVDTRLIIRECLDDLREDHRAVVELCVLEGRSARETTEMVNSRIDGRSDDSMSEQNVHQIVSRFRKDLRQRLEGTGKSS